MSGLEAFGTTFHCIELLSLIVRTTEEAKALKKECVEVGKVAGILKRVLEEKQDVLKDQRATAELAAVLKELSGFVAVCKESGFFHRAWEVLWKRRLPRLLKDMLTWIALLNTETVTSTRSDLWALINKTNQNRTYQETCAGEQQTYMRDILARLQILDELKKDMAEERSPDLGIEFPEGDTRLSVTKDTGANNLLSGTLLLDDTTTVDVVCEPVQESLMRYGQKGPRYVLIYAQLSANTLVHPFYGIAQHSDRKWAVMRDFRNHSTLGGAIRNAHLPTSLPERLELAHSIAKTVEYLHSVEILVKHLSDKTVRLFSENGKITPYLTDLEKARLFKEHTTGGLYDIRYEAPEFYRLPGQQHSIYTDIWSLGILIWECVAGEFPFGSSEEVIEGPEAARIRGLAAQSELPWGSKQDDALLLQVAKLLDRCCNARPDVRPSAADVAHSLFEILMSFVASIPSVADQRIDESAKDRVSDRLQSVDKKREWKSTGERPEKLEDTDVRSLQTLAATGDPTAAFLLGSATWYGLVEPEGSVDDMTTLGDEEERRARSALPYLEFAMQAGVKAAAEPLMRIHGALMKLYYTYVAQYGEFETLEL